MRVQKLQNGIDYATAIFLNRKYIRCWTLSIPEGIGSLPIGFSHRQEDYKSLVSSYWNRGPYWV